MKKTLSLAASLLLFSLSTAWVVGPLEMASAGRINGEEDLSVGAEEDLPLSPEEDLVSRNTEED